ncbi:DUF1543 domain-containing protein [Mucilaginibacter mali]|uniref:DUF1543 domain-containing protein n=1 Tax=Mucilaginibacter mali TaxID=2740462 RepID=A0A7D4UJL9_9SPHI|nr:DUF1543 domain-containing protein [Mucilaginibacter mali]QKJ29342.1 DUF1543 domain-containing protein [Mucilaginibacter mali]
MKSQYLFMVLLGSKAPARNTEQHDFFFGIASELRHLVPAMRNFWPEAGNSLHIDGWRRITHIDGYRVEVMPKDAANTATERLFFINLGGYTSGKLEEQHYTLLTVQNDRLSALSASKLTAFFKTATIAKVKGANAHIDEKYGIDVDEIYRVDDLLSDADKAAYHIALSPDVDLPDDEIHLGYLQLHKL